MSTMGKMKNALFVLIVLIAAAVAAQASIVGSAHDFSKKGWGSNEICIFCHGSHGGMSGGSGSSPGGGGGASPKGGSGSNGVPGMPAWNHQMSTATYTLYRSSSLKGMPEQPRGPSKLCLSCHDGTVAVDSYNGRNGTNFITGRANLGTDLSGNHPISIRWNQQPNKEGLPAYDGYLECNTCHDPHNGSPQYPKMLRAQLAGSVLCLSCHAR